MRAKEWYAANTEKARARNNAAYKANPKEHAIRMKIWRESNQEKLRKDKRDWQVANPDKCRAIGAKRKATKLQASPAWANEFFIKEAYHLAKLREKVCGGKWHVDHIVPLQSKIVCGLHVEQNLRVIPRIENVRKGNRHWPDMPTSLAQA